MGGSKYAAAASKVAGAWVRSCRFVSMDATAKPSFSYGSRLTVMAWRLKRDRTLGTGGAGAELLALPYIRTLLGTAPHFC